MCEKVGGHPFGAAWRFVAGGCWDRTGVDVVAAGFGWVCTVLMFSGCGLNV